MICFSKLIAWSYKASDTLHELHEQTEENLVQLLNLDLFFECVSVKSLYNVFD